MNKELATNTTLSHYYIVSKIGEGGMGEVYLGEDSRLHRKVALKILPLEMAVNQDRMRRFKQEATAAAALNHPNIAHIYEIGESDGTNFIAMEFVEGVTLREKIHRERTELRKLLRYLQHVAEGLVKAHAAGIVHRDLKPDNILITRVADARSLCSGLTKRMNPPLPEPPVADHTDEAATAILQQHSTPGMIMGTVGYMSPEQAQGKTGEIDQRSDVFSFGCILFEAATGRKPFEGDSIVKSLHSLIYEPAPQVKDLNPSAPADLQRIIRRCLAKDKDERYQTIKDVAIELKELRRELESSADFDTTAAPPTGSATAPSTNGRSTVQSTAARSGSMPPVVSSAEYLVSGIRKYKRSVGVALAILLVVISGAGYWFFKYRGSGGGGNEAINSIAVLPFRNKSADADTDYLSDGLAESLIFRLSQIPGLKVSPTSSVMRYKGKETDIAKIAAELGVDSVMTGRLIKRGDNLNITVELVDVRNNKSLWGEQYERKMSDLMTTQREIATNIAEKLRLKLSGEREQKLAKKYTNSNEAYQLYLKRRFYWNKRDEQTLRKPIEQFKAAVEKDPNYALAFVGLADSYVLLPFYSNATANDVTPQAKAYAERALEIDGSLGEAHAALGYVNRLLWNWAETETELKRAIELNPNYATAHKYYGNYLSEVGRFDESLTAYKRAQELEPLSLIISANLAELFLTKGDLNAAVEQCQRAIDIDPNWYYIRQLLSLVYLKQGRNAEALAEVEKSVELSKRQSVPLGVLGYIYAKAGKRSEATAMVEELKQRYAAGRANGFDLARTYVGLDEKDQAFAWLEKDVQSRNATMPGFILMPPLDSLRDDPRFKGLVRRIGFPEVK